MSGFCHLHLHSEYSLLEGACRVRDIPDAVLAAGQTAVALTDRASMSGCAEFFRACTGKNVKPLIGCEIDCSILEGSRGSLVFLCENETGYRNLCGILSAYCTQRAFPKEPLPLSFLKERKEGLIVLSGGTEGELFSLISSGEEKLAEKAVLAALSVFGKDSFFVELQNHLAAEERQLVPRLYELARKTGARAAVSNDVHYLSPEDAQVQTALSCIGEGRTLDAGPGLPTGEYWLKTEEQMNALFGGYSEAMKNTEEIAGRCDFSFDFGKRYLPSYPLSAGKNAADELAASAREGLDSLVRAGKIPAVGHTLTEYADRLEYELSVIHGMGYDDYFLIVADYVGFAKKSGIEVGPGRGSACGSLTSYCTGITEVDPIAFDLYFERFLNPERVSMPDIDVDFDFLRRDEMLAYVREKYGADRVAQIITFGTLAPRAALRDACRISGMTPSGTDAVCALLPEVRGTLREEAETGRLDAIKKHSPEAASALDVAVKIEGFPRNISVHAAGVVITDLPVCSLLPLTLSGDAVITQFDMDTVASLGILKFDFLALRFLTVAKEAEESARAGGASVSAGLPDRDEKTFSLLSRGLTAGVFQLESPGITNLIRRMRPDCLEDLISAIALFRPGPMDSIPAFIEGKKNPSKVVYPHPLLEPVLRPTYGCIVYQEQVMSVFRILAGYSAGHADLVRRAMSKKKASALEEERDGFVSGAVGNGMTPDAAGELFDSMTSFAGYAFNRSHAVAYGMITYRTAYLKAHFPEHYIAALLNAGGSDKMSVYAAECEKLGIRILPPDVNLSSRGFSAENGAIRFGIGSIKNAGPRFADAVTEERRERPFDSLEDFLSRMPQRDLNKKAVESAILCGAFDFTGRRRSALTGILEERFASYAGAARGGVDGQLDIFAGLSADEGKKKPEPEEYSAEKLAAFEKEICGTSFGHRPETALHAGRTSVRTPEPSVTREVVRLFVRVPSKESETYRRCSALAGIFDGRVPLFFYFDDKKEYSPFSVGTDGSRYLIGELKRVAGADAVAVKTSGG